MNNPGICQNIPRVQRHGLVELRFGGESGVALVTPQASVLFPSERAGCFGIFDPEVAFHAWGDHNLASVVVYGSIGKCGVEGDAVGCGAALDAPAQLSAIYQYGTVFTQRAFPPLPCFGEKALPLEVAVELFLHFHTDVLKY